ncbi:MAG TPA: hypothetical protein VLC95_04175 [Anaerolineae bacterium]|nr:hypothetical protein [Anaerolineae bacterium]
MHRKNAAILLFALLLLTACDPLDPGPTPTPAPPQVGFSVTLRDVQPLGEMPIELRVSNMGTIPLPADTFRATFELRTKDGELRASGTALLPPLAASTGEERTVIGWDGVLDAGEYELLWGAPELGSTLVEFEIVAENGRLRLGPEVHRRGPVYPRPDAPAGS